MSEESRMLARTWTIAATTCEPSDYDIPEAPVFPSTRCESGALMFHNPVTGAVAMVAGDPVRVRH
ncbi:hypothetical protein SAMN04488065_1809 [Haloplanus vescus]|uniref:Uncharacterized protein n=1 Tax=Haloplanus vescus TaxID=555874 RepID=A0A1H3YEW3_9EURY|nr:hypothetical protein [Haloplanus vescus]SEA09554.1 hypothetical protein SAMN04488065_1809 [Haloplanus vescus]